MKNPNISRVLKAYRKLNHLSVNDIVLKLESHNLPVAAKTVYGWESGQTQPDADTLLVLCKIYHIDDILGTFGYRDAADPLSLSEEERNLVMHYRVYPDMQRAIKKLLEMD